MGPCLAPQSLHLSFGPFLTVVGCSTQWLPGVGLRMDVLRRPQCGGPNARYQSKCLLHFLCLALKCQLFSGFFFPKPSSFPRPEVLQRRLNQPFCTASAHCLYDLVNPSTYWSSLSFIQMSFQLSTGCSPFAFILLVNGMSSVNLPTPQTWVPSQTPLSPKPTQSITNSSELYFPSTLSDLSISLPLLPLFQGILSLAWPSTAPHPFKIHFSHRTQSDKRKQRSNMI